MCCPVCGGSEGGGTIVVLAEQEKTEMEEFLQGQQLNLLGTEVICR
jgi:hypothetical protein